MLHTEESAHLVDLNPFSIQARGAYTGTFKNDLVIFYTLNAVKFIYLLERQISLICWFTP